MINNPKHGWCNFRLGNFVGHPSYLTNVPIDMLEAFIYYWTNSNSLSIFFDEEGSDFTLVVTPYNVYIIEEKDSAKLHVIDTTAEQLTNELINDIENDIDNWSKEFCIDEDDTENKKELENLLNKLKQIITNRINRV